MESLNSTRTVNRQHEKGQTPKRTQRVFMRHRQWYFMSRDGAQHGPYTTITEARRELAIFLRRSGVVEFSLK